MSVSEAARAAAATLPPSAFRRAPQALARKAFTIGLAPVAPADWIDVDETLPADLAMKETILAGHRADAFQALPGSEAAQAEARDCLVAHLTARFPALYRREGEAIRVTPAELVVSLEGEPPLLAASRLVSDDLAVLTRDDEGWRLVAASLCFPSTWVLQEKVGRPMAAIHAPVPGFEGQMAMRVARIFDSLKGEAPLERYNLSIYGDAELRHAEARQAPQKRFPPDAPLEARAHLRIERQTLRRLPASGAILFTIRVYVDSLAALRDRRDGATLARTLHAEIAAMTPQQLAYKGLTEARERLLVALAALGTQ